jgi:hypothetical protein
VLGSVVLALGVAALSGLDKRVEAWMTELAPQWLIDLSSKY